MSAYTGFRKFVIGNEKSEKSNFVWNMIGSMIYAMSTILMSYLTIRIVGEKDGGIFAIALTLAQMFVYIAYFEMRTYQVTDAKNEFSFSQYFTTKILTCIIMILASIGYILINGYDRNKACVVFLVCVLKMIDGFADVYESQFHRDGYLNVAGKSLAYRTMVMMIVYFGMLILTHKLLITMVVTVLFACVLLYVFDIYIYRALGETHIEKKWKIILDILKKCFPLFIGVFLWTYILSASRLAVDKHMSSEYQAYFQVIFLPVSVINLFAGFVFRPMLMPLTEMYAKRENRKFWGIIGKMIVIIFLITLICLGGTFVLGIPVLNIVSGLELSAYKGMLLFIILAGGINAIAFVLYYVLTICRAQISIIAGYGISALIAMIISPLMVKSFGLWGASVAYGITVLVMAVLFILMVMVQIGRGTAKYVSRK